jgi:rSAM/selenodomain-associated transferase 1
MTPRRHLVVFARAPVLGRVKRRLAAEIGPLAALRFHRGNTARLLNRLARDGRWQCWLALTPDRHAGGKRFWRVPCRRIAQGPGDLGRRMAGALTGLPRGLVVIVGSDIPGIQPFHVAAAFRALGRSDLVFGPAEDGGYWLIGTSGRTLPYRLFAGVRWSSAHALADTLRNVPPRLRVGFATTLADVDDGAAWRRWLRSSADAR